MISRIALAACFALIALSTSRARASDEQEAALCRGDVMRLCLTAIPDRSAIVACMKVNRASLSAGCRTVFDAGTRGATTTRAATLR